MKRLILFFCLTSCATSTMQRKIASEQTVAPSRVLIEKDYLGKMQDRQRLGLFIEDADVKFKGCVLYLEGLGDSFYNHLPLFNRLNRAGYRVITFDYLGQGGSEGDMNSTRIDAGGVDYEIGQQARRVWARNSDRNDSVMKRSCAGSPKMVIGWSTGGLAAYKLAYEKWADAVVLIAPGIAPNICIGESSDPTALKLKCAETVISEEQLITERTLTSATYGPGELNPHLEPIRPDSPLKVLNFASNLIATAWLKAPLWRIGQNSKGLVFLSGPDDSYIDRKITRNVLRHSAPHFTTVTYENSLHEIDNETAEISGPMRERTVEFLDSVTGGIK